MRKLPKRVLRQANDREKNTGKNRLSEEKYQSCSYSRALHFGAFIVHFVNKVPLVEKKV